MTRTIFIPTYSKSKVNKSKILEISKKLPENLAIAYSIQYKRVAEEIKEVLSKQHKITHFTQVLGCSHPLGRSPPLGCSQPNFSKIMPQAILLIGSGKFHAVSLTLETNLPIYILDNNNFQKISEKEIQNLKIQQKASYVKFLNAKEIGILISTKPNQQNLKKALEIKDGLKNQDKSSYLFIANDINTSEFENFPQIQSWINTACPRLDFDARIVNSKEFSLRD